MKQVRKVIIATVSFLSVKYYSLMFLLQWAYGVVLWEMSNLGRTPYDDLNEEEVAGYLEQGNRLSPSYLCHKEL